MKKLFTGIISALLVVGVIGYYIPNALAYVLEPPSQKEVCKGGDQALAQKSHKGHNSAEQDVDQGQKGDSSSQSVASGNNAFNGNNVNIFSQQNGSCAPSHEGLGSTPVGSGSPMSAPSVHTP